MQEVRVMERQVICSEETKNSKVKQVGMKLIDNSTEIAKAVLNNNKEIMRTILDIPRGIGKIFESFARNKMEKEAVIKKESLKNIGNAQMIIQEELRKENLNEEERKKLFNMLDKTIPNEEGIEAIKRGTGVAKTLFTVVGLVAVTAIVVTKKKNKQK